ncbi:hypothetical protein [Aliihoeflea sp. 2WW]|uniref:hypothetical protein n=1 Tax=Aliihoeflea sp. 2WW TaxID=1381123 RepID=UPI0004A402C7|nr:hypothetical protein [Aliihoeflea sp. 2WW]
MQIVATGMKTLALGCALTATTLTGAFAQDVDAALARMKVLMAEQGVTLDWADAEISGANATLTGVTVTSEGTAEPIGDIEVTGIADAENGYRVGSIEMPTYTATEAGGTLTLTDLVMDEVFLPNEGLDVGGAEIFFYERAALGAATLETDGREIFSLTNLNVEITPPEDDGELAFTGGADAFTADLSVSDDPKHTEVLTRLGYEQVSGSMAFAGSWAAGDGRLKLSQYDFVVDDAGTLGISFDVSGYTPEFIKALRETSERMAASSQAEQSRHGLAMLGLMQQLSLYGLEITYDDASLTTNVLEFAAEEQEISAADVANQTKAVLPFMMAGINAPQLSQMVTAALSQFLDNPQSLTIRAAPAQPVPFSMLLAAGMASPDALVQQLNLSVTAND